MSMVSNETHASAQETRTRISSLRSKLSSFCWSEELVNCLTTYLSENDLGEEDPVLLVNYLPQLTAQNLPTDKPLPAARRQAIVDALVAVGGEDIGGLGVAFRFPSHNALQTAKINLGVGTYPGNVQWAFIHGLGCLQSFNEQLAAMTPPGPVLHPDLPSVETRLITLYSRASGRLDHDRFSFFEYH